MKRLVTALDHSQRAVVFPRQGPLFQRRPGHWGYQLLDRLCHHVRTHPQSREVVWFSMVYATLCHL